MYCDAADVARLQQKKAAQERISKEEMKRILVTLLHHNCIGTCFQDLPK